MGKNGIKNREKGRRTEWKKCEVNKTGNRNKESNKTKKKRNWSKMFKSHLSSLDQRLGLAKLTQKQMPAKCQDLYIFS